MKRDMSSEPVVQKSETRSAPTSPVATSRTSAVGPAALIVAG